MDDFLFFNECMNLVKIVRTFSLMILSFWFFSTWSRYLQNCTFK